MKRLWWSLVCVLALGIATGCDDNGTNETDAGPPDGGTQEPAPALKAAEGGELVDPDFSCEPTAPMAGDEATFTVQADDFFTGDPVEGLTVHFFPNNMPSSDQSCDAPCQSVTTNASGQATVMGNAGAWYAYRVLAGEGTSGGDPKDYIGVVQVNEISPEEGGNTTLNVVNTGTRNTILGFLSISQVEGTAVVTGQALDCQGRPLANARVRLFDANGEITLSNDTPTRSFYFASGLPAARQSETNTDGLYGATNITLPADGRVRVETWGVREGDTEPTIIGCEWVQIGADGITIINVGPKRSDGPTDCSM